MNPTKKSPPLAETGPMVSAQPEDNPDHTGIILSNDPSLVDKAGVPSPVTCEYCGKALFYKGVWLSGKIKWIASQQCNCPAAVAVFAATEAARKAKEDDERKAGEARKFAARKKRLIGDSGMGVRFLQRTFDSFVVTDNNKKAFDVCWNYAKGFDRCLPTPTEPVPDHNGLFIVGTPGAGKTHLAAAIANHLISKGQSVICMTAIDLLDHIKRAYSPGTIDASSIIDLFKNVSLLIIDDLGKEPPTEWAIATLYNIINGRYEACLPIVVTTNYDSNTLIQRMTPRDSQDSVTAQCILDRLMETCDAVVLTGASWRRKA